MNPPCRWSAAHCLAHCRLRNDFLGADSSCTRALDPGRIVDPVRQQPERWLGPAPRDLKLQHLGPSAGS